ncbi:hypothetical protein ACN27F_30575 [Solwaraspora sp. WMMB335]|uniref:hypothetical protein n=1 Tax=Solwaraspora sp. WMMB335 TaxID=3404118 RepID=UPI003B95F7EE
MQPMPIPQHPGPAELEENAGAGDAPAHGTPVPAPRPVVDGNVINEATTEIPLIVPKEPAQQTPNPLPPIATALLGGTDTPPLVVATPTPAQPADRPDPDDRTDPDDQTQRADQADQAEQVDPSGAETAPEPEPGTEPTAGTEPTTAVGEPVAADGEPAAADGEPADQDPEEGPAAVGAGSVETAGTADTALDAQTDQQPESESAVTSGPADSAAPGQSTPEAEGSAAEPAASTQRAEPDDDDEPVGVAEADDAVETGDDDADALSAHGDAGDLFYDDDYDQEDDEDEDEELDAVLTAVDEQADRAAAPEAEPVAAPKRPGEVSLPPITIWTEEAADELRDEWHEIKARFVDEPDVALAQAQSLVAHAVRTLADRLSTEQLELDPRRDDEAPDTESMRVALRQYREFLDRLLAI